MLYRVTLVVSAERQSFAFTDSVEHSNRAEAVEIIRNRALMKYPHASKVTEIRVEQKDTRKR